MILRPRKKMDTVEKLVGLAVTLAEKAGDLEAASDIEQFSLAGQSPTEIRYHLTGSDPHFKCTDADLALQQAERELNSVNLARLKNLQ